MASSVGISKFFLMGPIPLIPKDYPLNGLISPSFVCMLLLNTMFGIRLVCVENAFFSSYRYVEYHENLDPPFQKTIDPVIPPEYRLLVYFTPSLISFIINTLRLLTTGAKFGQHVRKYPQLLIASCFTPFMFESSKGNSIRIWKFGSVLNAIFIGCLPQIILIFMDFYRGVVDWDFVGLALRPELITENNDSLFQNRFGSIILAVVSSLLFSSLIILTFFTKKILKNCECCCQCCSILCLNSPKNCLILNTEMDLSHSSPINFNRTNDESVSELSTFTGHSYENVFRDGLYENVHSHPSRNTSSKAMKEPNEVKVKPISLIKIFKK